MRRFAQPSAVFFESFGRRCARPPRILVASRGEVKNFRDSRSEFLEIADENSDSFSAIVPSSRIATSCGSKRRRARSKRGHRGP